MKNYKSLIKWCAKNRIRIKKESEFVFCVPKIGRFLSIEGKGGYIIGKELTFIFSNKDWHRFDEFEPDFILYEFGGSWYYSKPIEYNDEYKGFRYQADFIDFKHVGRAKQSDKTEFCHLGIHSEYELLNGSGDANDWVKKAKFLGHKVLGICDKHTLGGVLKFQIACGKMGIKSIIGETIMVVDDYQKGSDLQDSNELKLYVVNKRGWLNLLQINNRINSDEAEYIDFDFLSKHSEGLIAVFARNSVLKNNLNSKKRFLKYLIKYKEWFSSVYYQIDSVEFFNDSKDMEYLNSLKTYITNYADIIKPVLINDTFYIDEEMKDLKSNLNAISGNVSTHSEVEYYKCVDDINNSLGILFAKSKQWDGFKRKCIKNTNKLASECNYIIETGVPRLPKYNFTKNGESSNDYLIRLIAKGIKNKIQKRDKIKGKKFDEYMNRIQIELDVIIPALVSDYFLILWDIINWSKEQGVVVGIGRGSVGGSLVAYALDIIDIDPIKYDLLFERFLNKTRIEPIIVDGKKRMRADSMPDIDVDFPSYFRETAKQYIKDRFGINYTCSVGTYTKLQLKASLTDFASVKGLNFQKIKFITKGIEHQVKYKWKDLFRYALRSRELMKFIQEYPDVVHNMKYAFHAPRASSIHASAVLILPDNDGEESRDVNNWLPLKRINGTIISEWEGEYTDSAGFLKEDILGLRQLDMFMNMNDLIEQNGGKRVEYNKIPVDDKKTYKMYAKGYNEDVFQFGSAGMRQYIKQVKPNNIEDIIAMNALYRPGAMSSNAHTDFAKIKHGEKEAEFDVLMEKVTENTHGLYAYQEQIMQAMVIGGLSLVEADQVRTYMKKFKHEEMMKFKQKFIDGLTDKYMNLK